MTQSLHEDIHAYLDRHQRKELLRFLTCGSVDDGKSTLIGRLLHDTKGIYEDQLAAVKKDSLKHGTTGEGQIDLALLTDGLRAEREQGIAIDNPTTNDDPLGLRVRTCCKTIPATLIGKRHCYFEFDSGPHKTIGFHFDNEESALEVGFAVVGLQTARVAYNHGFDTDPGNPGTCGPWSKCADSCVEKAAAEYGVRRYSLFGPNSNTFAAYVTHLCGLTPPNRQETDNAPGWYTPPPQVPYVPWSEFVNAYNKVSHSP